MIRAITETNAANSNVVVDPTLSQNRPAIRLAGKVIMPVSVAIAPRAVAL